MLFLCIFFIFIYCYCNLHPRHKFSFPWCDNWSFSISDFISPKSKGTYERQAGESFTLKCNATNSTNVWWRHQNWRENRIVRNATELNLKSISQEDQGSYTCIAKGLRGQFVESDASQTLIISGKWLQRIFFYLFKTIVRRPPKAENKCLLVSSSIYTQHLYKGHMQSSFICVHFTVFSVNSRALTLCSLCTD